MTLIRKYLRLIIGGLIVAAIALAALWPEVTEVDAAAVTRGPLQVTLDEDGETRVRQRFVVSAPLSGRLQRIELEPGDTVVRGKTVVARLTAAPAPLLDPRTQAELGAALEAARAGLGTARAERDRASAALDRARASLKRYSSLARAGAVAPDALEAMETEARTAEETARASQFAVSRAEHEVELARARMQPPASGGRTVEVTAPVDGVVLRRLRESETVVPVGEPLVEIGDPAALEIVADLLSTDAVRVRPGSPVLIEQWGGSDPLAARVRRVEPSGFMKVSALGVEEQRVNVIMDFADPAGAARALGDGYRVEVRVVVWREQDVVKAPVGGLFRRGEDWAAFVVEGDRIRLRAVRLGQRNATEAQILEGLAPGDRVVLFPPDTLADGDPVRLRQAGS
jgi:HlyD family secretion protein